MKTEKLISGWQFCSNGVCQEVSLPHDFMLATPRTKDSPTRADYGYFQPCHGTYTRSIIKTSAARHFIKLDGSMGLTEVFLNGEHIAFHPYGYTAFICDLTPFIHEGENELKIEVDAMNQPASRWYTGAGLFRDVELMSCDADYILPFGVTVKILKVSGDEAEAEFCADVSSSKPQAARLSFSVSELGFVFERSTWLNCGENHFTGKTLLRGFSLWSHENPVVYNCTAAFETGLSKDETAVTFGIRTVVCDPERGLLLNGKPTKLYGACIHHDNGIVGAASYRSAEERRIRTLKENGFNAIRCSHNPPSSVLLDVCDRMGMMVIDEIFDCWAVGKHQNDYHLWFDRYAGEDITSMVQRDRNHPAVIMWSTGNEIHERAGRSGGYRIAKMIADTIREQDNTRPLTHAFCHFWDNGEYLEQCEKTFKLPPDQPDFWCEKIAPHAGNLDVLGYNYLTHRVNKDEKIFRSHLFAVTESYPMDAVYVKNEMDKHNSLIGEFVWTGWDYFGETGLGHIVYGTDSAPAWGLTEHPEHIANCGDFDICGFRKAQSYYRSAAWNKGSIYILSMNPDNYGRIKTISSWGFHDVDRSWTYTGREGRKTSVYIFTTAEECELWVNGKPLGRKAPDYRGIAVFDLEYNPGRLEAKAYIGGKICGEDFLETTGKPCKLTILPDTTGKTGKPDLIYAEISLIDSDGKLSYEAKNDITVEAIGGRVIGTGSGIIASDHDYTSNSCQAYHGRILAAVLPETNEVKIIARSGDMSDTVSVRLN